MQRDLAPVRVDVRAVDIGYFNVKYTLGRTQAATGWPIATGIFPALAPRVAPRTMLHQLPGTSALDGWTVAVDGVDYFVGRDATFGSSGIEARTIPEDYSATPRYIALLRGALAYMAADADPMADLWIERLVLALPLHSFPAYRDQLAARATGEHVIGPAHGPHRRVTVEHADVIVQPHGALLDYGVRMHGRLDGWALVVDPGGGTLDWYVASKAKTSWARSGAHPKAMLECAYAVLDQIGPGLRDQHQVVERVDAAIREGAASFRLQGRDHPVAPHMALVQAVLDDGLDKMMAKVGSVADLDLVILAGGGAKVFERFLADRRPDLAGRLYIDADPVFSNVRGFQLYGELMRQRQLPQGD